MKRSSLALIASFLIFTIAPPLAQAQKSGLVNSILNRMEQNRRSLRSLRASISMERYNAQIRDVDRYAGTVIYLPGSGRNARVRVEWNSPQHEILVVSDGKYTLFRPRLNTAYVGNANSTRSKVANVLGFGLNVSRRELESRFHEPEYMGEETLWGGVHTVHLKLVPKGQANFKHAEIWVDDSGMPIQVKVVEKNDDSTTVRLTNLQRNVRLSPDEFRLRLGPEVKKIQS
ncbi:LolA family protein [Pyrinomonas methylaliphatogenes]|jgi:outer membrane lipoprotein-sorting protein|uniref:Outer membrane lipoprotein-sorting protein n=1 Tax=Pyrinomonas methylaliphatogenes TaxID=454194 RepID=A0A0B6WUP5_9BACT|nr:outer membrane lipoprotein carrier protein LolA [Pyrinomonas methylaliphatogenes]MBX5478691.1 outer-membrane lipoprotein carrier protein LolA [Pyrinomonas methylaliphatogenes]CDM64963.1 outer membrane lipoprotein-sorting protein [Pyrinomonas methylaliphatogenes]